MHSMHKISIMNKARVVSGNYVKLRRLSKLSLTYVHKIITDILVEVKERKIFDPNIFPCSFAITPKFYINA